LWNCFGEEVFLSVQGKKNQKYVRIPTPDPKGNIEYLFEKYSIHLINIED